MYYQSSIQANPLFSPQQHQQAMQGFSRPVGQPFPLRQAPGVQMGQRAQNSLMQQLMQAQRGNANRDATLFGRQYAMQDAQHLNNAEAARAQAGLAGNQYNLGRLAQGIQQDQGDRNTLLRFLLPYLGEV